MAITTGVNRTDKTSKTKENLFTKDQWALFESMSSQIKNNSTILKNLENTFTQPASSLPDYPTVANLKSAKTLNTIVPTGFLMLHRDLERLAGDSSSEKGSGWSLSSGGSLLASGLLAAAGLLGAGLISSSLTHLMDELLNEVSASELADDEDIKNSVKAGLATYIRVFFITQAAYLGINVLSKLLVLFEGFKGMFKGTSDVLGTIALGSSVIGAAANTIQDVFADLGLGSGSLEKRQAEAVFALADDVLKNLDTSNLVNDESIQDSVRAGLAAYLKTFFYAQAAKLAINSVEDVTSYIGAAVMTGGWSLVVDAGINMVGKIADLFTGGQTTIEGRMQNLALSILEKLFSDANVDEIAQDKTVRDAMNAGVSSYIKAYFYAQAIQLSPANAENNATGIITSIFENITSLPGKLISGIANAVKGIADMVSGEESIDEKISTLAKDIIVNNLNSLKVEDVNGDQFRDVMKDAVTLYIKAYFGSLDLVGSEGIFEKGWNWLFGEKSAIDEDTSKQLIKNFNVILANAVAATGTNVDLSEVAEGMYSSLADTVLGTLQAKIKSDYKPSFSSIKVDDGTGRNSIDLKDAIVKKLFANIPSFASSSFNWADNYSELLTALFDTLKKRISETYYPTFYDITVNDGNRNIPIENFIFGKLESYIQSPQEINWKYDMSDVYTRIMDGLIAEIIDSIKISDLFFSKDGKIANNVMQNLADFLEENNELPTGFSYDLSAFYKKSLDTILDKTVEGLKNWSYTVAPFSTTSQNLTTAVDKAINEVSDYLTKPEIKVEASQTIVHNETDIITSFRDDTVDLLTTINKNITILEPLIRTISNKSEGPTVIQSQPASYDLTVQQPN